MNEIRVLEAVARLVKRGASGSRRVSALDARLAVALRRIEELEARVERLEKLLSER